MIDGKSMISRVYDQAKSCKALSDVIVATDDISIEKHVIMFGGQVMMTSPEHKSGTERCNEVCSRLAQSRKEYDLIVNIQGDEPYIDPRQIEQLTACFVEPGVVLASLMKKILSEKELNDPNVVKVIADKQGKALYFSRAAIPYQRDSKAGDWVSMQSYYRHVGIYGYRPDILRQIVKLPPSGLEISESLEQLRWLENGFEIMMKETDYESVSIDTPADLLKLTNRP
jgi:3-deoxy-manno-octulosonate cytidylyltransferase (CMP-KDO synthetase)